MDSGVVDQLDMSTYVQLLDQVGSRHQRRVGIWDGERVCSR